jgi:D-inositol-3-phosphate glycosyltransferase
MSMRIAMISEHASPLSTLGGADSGGQNVYVGQIAANLARAGHHVDLFTRRDDPAQPEVVPWTNGVRIVPVAAGPPAPVRKEDLLPFMPEFTRWMLRFMKRDGIRYDLSRRTSSASRAHHS